MANELKAYDEDGQLGVIRWALGYLLTPSDEEIAVTKEQIVVENVYWQVKKPYFSDRITVLDPVELDSLQNAIKDARENQTLEKSNEEIFPNETRKTYDFVTKGALASLIGGIGVLFAGVRTLRSRRVRFAGDRLKDDDLAEQINGFKHSLISPPSANSVLTEDDSELNDGGFSRVRELDRLAEERSLDIKIFGEGLSRVIGTARKADPAGTLLVVIAGTISSGKTGVKDYSTSLLTGAGETVVFLDSERFLIPADKRNKSLSYPRLKFDVDEHNKVLAALKKGEHAFVKFTDRNIRQHITLTPAERQRCRYLSGERTIYGQHALNRIMDEEIMRHVLKYQAKIQSRLWFDEENGEIFEEIVPEKETFLVISDIALIEPYSDKRFDYSCFVWMPRQERKNNFIESWARGEQYAGIFKNKSEVAAYFDLLAKEDEILLQGVPYADAVVRPDPVTTTASILGTGQDGGFAEGDGRQSINTVFAVHLDEYPATDKIKQMNKMAYRAAFEDGLFKEYIAGQIADFIQRNYNNKISCPLKINNIDIIYENRGGFKDIFRVSVVVSPEVNATETQKKQLADQGFTGKVDFCLPALRPYYEAFKGERSSSVETFGKDFREEFDRLKDFQKLGEETERRLMVEPYSLKVQQTGNVLYYLREWVDGDTAAQLFAAKKIGVDKIEDIVSAWMTVVKVLRKYVRNPGLNNVMMRTDGSFVIADPGLVSSINERLVIFSLDNHCRLAGVPNEQAMRKAIFSGVIKALGEVEGRDFLISALEQGKEDKFALDLKLFLEESAISTPDGGVKDFVGSIEMRGGGVKVLGVVDNSRSPKTIAVVHTGSLVPARENDSKEHRILLVQPSEVTGYTPRQCIEIVRKLAQTKNKDVIDNLGINLKDNLERILTKNFLVVENTLVVMSPEGVILTGRVDSWFRGEIRNLVMKERVGKKVFNRKDVGDGLDNLKNEILAEYKAQKKKPASKEGVAAPQDGGAEDLVITKVYGKDFEVRKDISTGIKLCDGRNYKSNNPAIDARVLFELYKQIHPDIVFDNPANKKYDLRRFERLLKGNDPKEFLWVYEPVPGQIKGYLTAEFFLYDYFNIANNKTVFIGQVAVATDTQKQGVATALWLAAMQFMERRKVTTYKVTALSPYSASIAERLGWKKTADNGKAARYSYNAFDGGDAGRLDGGATAPGGVDFRELPVSGQPSIAPVLMPQLQKLAQNSRMKDLDREWNNIRGEMLAPEMPYNRIKEYIAVCLNRPGCRKKLDQAVTCIIDILRMEEDQALATNQELKDILMYLS
ncbi:MAG: GNAT family N-acetyltransferase [Candidatus Omnitrophica bacterium]|nr:GNAT family N-acetyltransferase [Candidatus Omnitrophota bacterium]